MWNDRPAGADPAEPTPKPAKSQPTTKTIKFRPTVVVQLTAEEYALIVKVSTGDIRLWIRAAAVATARSIESGQADAGSIQARPLGAQPESAEEPLAPVERVNWWREWMEMADMEPEKAMERFQVLAKGRTLPHFFKEKAVAERIAWLNRNWH